MTETGRGVSVRGAAVLFSSQVSPVEISGEPATETGSEIRFPALKAREV
jgi:hypothetical protein